MKKWFLTLLVALPLGVLAGQALSSVDEINVVVSDLLAPYQRSYSKMTLKFSDLNLSTTNVNLMAGDAYVWAQSADNTLDLVVNDFEFVNQLDKAPELNVSAALRLDLAKAFGQSEINKYMKELNKLALGFVKDATDEYENAVTATATVTDVKVDAAGNFESLSFELSAEIDLLKLPKYVKVSSVELTDFNLKIEIDKLGAAANLNLVFNEQYRGFDRDQVGMKEYLEGLRNKDSKIMRKFSQFADFVASFAVDAVDGKLKNKF